MTLTRKLHAALFPLPSTASQMTVVCPMGKLLPARGSQITIETFPELSVTVGFSHVATAVAEPSFVSFAMIVSAQLIFGRSESVRDSTT